MADEQVNDEVGVGSGNDERVALLNRIGAQVEQEYADQMADVNDDGTTSEFTPEALPVTDEDTAALQAIEEETPTAPVEEEFVPAPVVTQKHKIKVNGVEQELTTEELIARASKVSAADVYLAEAARLRREAEQQAVTPPQPSQEDVAARQLEEERALVRALQMGTEEEAIAALRQIKQTAARPSLTQDDVAKTVDERLSFQDAIAQFRTEYKDIASNPQLDKMAKARDAELLQLGDRRPYMERYRAIGEEVRAFVVSLAPAVTPAAPAATTEKQARKAAAPSVPAAANTKSKPPVSDDDKEESYADIIANIAKARGGPQWSRA